MLLYNNLIPSYDYVEGQRTKDQGFRPLTFDLRLLTLFRLQSYEIFLNDARKPAYIIQFTIN